MKQAINTPVVMFIFKRLDTTKQVLERIREVRPPKLYIVGEGPRPSVPGEAELVNQVRKMVEDSIDWPCEVYKNYVPEDIGVGKRMSSGIDWVFKNEERAIFLEDDIFVDKSFFFYAEELLERYAHDDRVMMISARNSVPSTTYAISGSYTFTSFGSIWGWASWRSAWEKYDFTMSKWPEARKNKTLRRLFNSDYAYKRMTESSFDSLSKGLNTWDFQWNFAMMINNGLTVVPKDNLMTNVGFRKDGTHTVAGNKTGTVGEIHTMKFPLVHPTAIERNADYDGAYCSQNYKEPSVIQRVHIFLHHIKRKIFRK